MFATNQTGLEEGYMLLVQRNSALEDEHQALKEKFVLLESRCEQYESSIVELREAVQSLRVSRGRPPPVAPRIRDTWVGFSDYHDSAHSRPPAPLPSQDGASETDKDPFCFRP